MMIVIIKAKRVAVVEREELQQLAGEGQPLSHGLRVRLEKEREARHRGKANVYITLC